MNTLVIPGMMEHITDGYLGESEEDKWAEQCMQTESDPGLNRVMAVWWH